MRRERGEGRSGGDERKKHYCIGIYYCNLYKFCSPKLWGNSRGNAADKQALDATLTRDILFVLRGRRNGRIHDIRGIARWRF